MGTAKSEETNDTVLSLDSKGAREFFLRSDSYLGFSLPTYFSFQAMLEKVAEAVRGKDLNQLVRENQLVKKERHPSEYEGVNYSLSANKDGRFSYRHYQLIHPVVYVCLANLITQGQNWGTIRRRFEYFREHSTKEGVSVECLSVPALPKDSEERQRGAQIRSWLRKVEERSIEFNLQCSYMAETDISNCYGSIYTHSIPWALHGRLKAKRKRKPNALLGNRIDECLRSMSYGQTNGIPCGSVLMDFLAEMVLGYGDALIVSAIRRRNFLKGERLKILRYRDDYRIFACSEAALSGALKAISESLKTLNFQLNAGKTKVSENIVEASIKPDKYFWETRMRIVRPKGLRGRLLEMHYFMELFPNSGRLLRQMESLGRKLEGVRGPLRRRYVGVLLGILVDILPSNPKLYESGLRVASHLIKFIEGSEEKVRAFKLLERKIGSLPNTGLFYLWLQRLVLRLRVGTTDEGVLKELDEFLDDLGNKELLCKVARSCLLEGMEQRLIWNSDWLRKAGRDLVVQCELFDEEEFAKLSDTIDDSEYNIFSYERDSGGF